MDYRPRVIDATLDELLPSVGAVLIDGARAVGKTETALRRAATIFRLDNPAVFQTLQADPDLLTRSNKPVLIDEWQLLPETFDVVKRAVDQERSAGQYLLTGSASPRKPPQQTGAGRIVRLRMRPMTLAERGVTQPTVSVAELLRGTRPAIAGDSRFTLDQYAEEILASGFPGLRDLKARPLRALLDGYIEQVIDRDFEDLGGLRVRNPNALRRWWNAYASAISSTTSLERIRGAATAGREDTPTKVTALHWLATLETLGISDPIPAWIPSRNELKRLTESPKHQLVDPALAARLRGITIDALLKGASAGPLGPRDGTSLGALFEALVALDVRVYASEAEARVGHFRTYAGEREVDLILERGDRRIVAVEVKLTQTIDDSDIKHLKWLSDQLGDELLDAIVVTTGPFAYRRPDGIGVVPLALLGP